MWWLALVAGCGDAVQDAYDRDGDGYVAVQLDGDDCDDANQLVHPAAPEVCGDQIDNDCDGAADDDGFGAVTWYPDEDGDGFGADQATTSCVAPLGSLPSLAAGVDCDDANSAARPTATEACGDGVDNDCDGQTDEEGATAQTWLEDRDTDGYADPLPVTGCTPPDDALDDLGLGADCDDTDPDVNPGVEEVCGNDVDDDCDDQVDDDGLGAFTWYHDDDEDGYGDPTARTACDPPAGSLPNLASGADCDDNDPAAHPNAAEVWYDGRDQDCLGGDDFDQDHDGYQTDDIGGGDCNDLSALQNPGRPEICNNGFDDNCWDPEECNLGSGTLTSRAAATHTLTTGSLTDVVLGNFLGTPDLDLGVLESNNTVRILEFPLTSANIAADSDARRTASTQRNPNAFSLGVTPDHNADGFDDLFIPLSLANALLLWQGPMSGAASMDTLALWSTAPTTERYPTGVIGGRFVNSQQIHVGIVHAGLTVAVPSPTVFAHERASGPVTWQPSHPYRVVSESQSNARFWSDDVNEDGFDDVLVGGTTSNLSMNIVSVVFGPVRLPATDSGAPRIYGPTGADNFGCSVAFAAGFDETGVLAVGHPPTGVLLFEPPNQGADDWSSHSEVIPTNAGSSGCPGVATGDLNGDGDEDVVVSYYDPGNTRQHVLVRYANAAPGRLTDLTLTATESRPLGVRVADVDRDGRAELLLWGTSKVYIVGGRGD
jgi:hypothetical protein